MLTVLSDLHRDVDTQLSAFLREYLAVHVQVRRGVIELPAFFLSYAPLVAATQRQFSWQESVSPPATPAPPASGHWTETPASPGSPARVVGTPFGALSECSDVWTRSSGPELFRWGNCVESAASSWQRRQRVPHVHPATLGRMHDGRNVSKAPSLSHSTDSMHPTKISGLTRQFGPAVASSDEIGNPRVDLVSEIGCFVDSQRLDESPPESLDLMLPPLQVQDASPVYAFPPGTPRAPLMLRDYDAASGQPRRLWKAPDEQDNSSELHFTPSEPHIEIEHPRGSRTSQAEQQPQLNPQASAGKWKSKDPFLAALMRRKQLQGVPQRAAPAEALPPIKREAFRGIVADTRGSPGCTEEHQPRNRRAAEIRWESGRGNAFQQDKRVFPMRHSAQGQYLGAALQPPAQEREDFPPVCFQSKSCNCDSLVGTAGRPTADKPMRTGHEQSSVRWHPGQEGAPTSTASLFPRFLTSSFSGETVWQEEAEFLASFVRPCTCRTGVEDEGKHAPSASERQHSHCRQTCCTCVGAALQHATGVFSQYPHTWEAESAQRLGRAGAGGGLCDGATKTFCCPMGRSCRKLPLAGAAPGLAGSSSQGRLYPRPVVVSSAQKTTKHERAREALDRLRLIRWLIQHSAMDAAAASELAGDSAGGRLEWKPFIVQPVPLHHVPPR